MYRYHKVQSSRIWICTIIMLVIKSNSWGVTAFLQTLLCPLSFHLPRPLLMFLPPTDPLLYLLLKVCNLCRSQGPKTKWKHLGLPFVAADMIWLNQLSISISSFPSLLNSLTMLLWICFRSVRVSRNPEHAIIIESTSLPHLGPSVIVCENQRCPIPPLLHRGIKESCHK